MHVQQHEDVADSIAQPESQNLQHGLVPGRCSGSDAVNLTGSSSAIFHKCTFEAKKAGVRVLGKANGLLMDCRIQSCGEQGIHVLDHASLNCDRLLPCNAKIWQDLRTCALEQHNKNHEN